MRSRLQVILALGAVAGLFLVLSLRSQVSSQPAAGQPPSAQALLLRTNKDIGRVTLAGERILDRGRRDLRAGGFGVHGTEDSLHFDYRPLSGDGEVIARVILDESAAGLARAGLLLRPSLDPDAACVAVAVTPTNGVAFQWRERAGEPAVTELLPTQQAASTNRFWKLAPSRAWQPRAQSGLAAANENLTRTAVATKLAGKAQWLKLVRQGNAVSGWWSANGRDWKWLGTQEIELPRRVFVGPAVSSHNFNKQVSARFTDVKVRPLTTPESAPPPVQGAAEVGTGTGLRGFFFDHATSNRLSRLMPALDFHWVKGPPFPSLRKGQFTARWTGFLEARHSELHALEIVSGGGVRLWIDGRKVIDDWEAPADGALKTVKALVQLQAGHKHRFRLEYADGPKRSLLRLLWSSPSMPRQVIPQGCLYPPDWEKAMAAAVTAPEPTPLPAPWAHRDVGRLRQPGSVTPTATGFHVTASGFDIAGNADEFHFVFQPWAGDGEIVARVSGEVAPHHPLGAKAGVMIRESLAADAANVSLIVTHASGIRFGQRRKPSEEAVELDKLKAGDTWVRLVRRRNIFTASTSADGINWTWLGKTEVAMGSNVFVGLAVASKKYGASYSAHFEHVTVRGLQPGSRKLVGTGDGLAATYYDTATSNAVTRLDPAVNFAWGRVFPAEGIGRAPFSVRWQGLLEAQHSEPYALHLISDGNARVWLDGRLVLDDWTPHTLRERKARVELLAGHRYALQVEYVARKNAHVRLLWSGPSTPKRPIPQSQFYSPGHPYFAEIEDKDRDGMPDAWERLHGLNEFDASDAAEDPDGDGLSNLSEYLAGTNPRNPDTDGDGLPDGWEVKFGLNPLQRNSAAQDSDHDGLTDREEFLAGTDPTKADTDGDGLPDWLEVKESGTNPLVSDALSIATVAEVNGADAVSRLGRWTVAGQSIASEDRRGALEYALTTAQPGMFRLEIEGGPKNAYDGHRQFPLRVWVDGEYLGRFILAAPQGGLPAGRQGSGVIYPFTPWLKAGEHRVRVYWDNVASYRSFKLAAVRLQTLTGADADQNGVSDWIESRLRNTCTVEAGTLTSAVSPACLEGRGGYLSMMKVLSESATPALAPSEGERVAEGRVRGVRDLQPQPAPTGAGPESVRGWFANVPLPPAQPQTVVCSFQNDGLRVTNRVVWQPTDLLTAGDLTIRPGDALLLTASHPGETNSQAEIVVAGVTNYTASPGQPVAHQFTEPGAFTVTGTVISPRGERISRSINVTVVSAQFAEPPAAWTGKRRAWSGPESSRDVNLQADARLKLEVAASVGTNRPPWNLTTDATEQRHIAARIEELGLIIASTSVDGFRVYGGNKVYLRRTEKYPDGSELIEMGVVLSPVVPGVTVRVQSHAGGITFDDGTVLKDLTADDFDELGQASVRFLKPASAKTSVCHRTTAWQGDVFLGEHWSSEDTGL